MGAVLVFWVLVGLAVSGVIGLAIGQAKGRPGAGFLLGFFLGWIGWIIIAVMSRTPEAQARRDVEIARQAQLLGGVSAVRPCPWCAEMIKPAAIVCRFCGHDVPPGQAPVKAAPSPGHADRVDYYLDRKTLNVVAVRRGNLRPGRCDLIDRETARSCSDLLWDGRRLTSEQALLLRDHRITEFRNELDSDEAAPERI